MNILKTTFKPEFINRIDEIIVFKPLNIDDLEKIVKLLLENTKRLLKAQDISFEISENAIKQISRLGFDPQFGARPLSRIIQREIENPISLAILDNRFQKNDIIKVDFVNDKFTFSK
jgi:ATP-dependent Clp protease ATP-binding subunit ClpB